MLTQTNGSYMLYFLKEITISLVLFLVFLFAIIVCFVGLSAVASNSAQAATGKVQECKVWQVIRRNTVDPAYPTRRITRMIVKAETTAVKGLDRIATAKWMAETVAKKSGFDYVQIMLFGVGTKPNENDINEHNSVALVVHVPKPQNVWNVKNAWSGSYSDSETSDEITAAEEYGMNPSLEQKTLSTKEIEAFKYEKASDNCDLTAAVTGENFKSLIVFSE